MTAPAPAAGPTPRRRLPLLDPFGVASTKPRHFRDMLKIAWDNRDNARYAWRVLSEGVCDGCALGVAGFHDWTIDGVHLCMTRLNLLRLNTVGPLDASMLADVGRLRRKSNRDLRELGRLPYPVLRGRGDRGFRRVSWDDANALMARRVRATTPDRLAFFLTSRGITNEVYYVAQKVARFLGTNNVDNAARLCHSPSTGAMKSTLGVAASTCSYKDWFGTDLLVFFGSNPANDQPVAMKYIHRAKKQGTRVVTVNPYREPGMTRYWVPSEIGSAIAGTKIADHHFPVTVGGDIAFLAGAMKVMLENGWVDRHFIDAHTAGFEGLRAAVGDSQWEELERQSGLPRAAMAQFAELIGKASSAVLVWSMGITQHAFGGDAVQQILNLGLLKGFLGRDKCGLMPIRGHSGVQGGAEMGAYATAFPGGKTITPESARGLSDAYGFEVPGERGLAAPEMVEAAARGELDLLYSLGGNFLRTLPDPDYVARAMAGVPLRVHQDIILTDQMFIDPAGRGEAVLLLPAKTRYEQDGGGTETTTERRVVYSPQIPRPATHPIGEERSEWRILRDLAAAAYPERARQLGCETGDQIRAEIARVIPAYADITGLKRSGDNFQYAGPHLCPGGQCPTPDGRAHLRSVPIPDTTRPPGTFRLTTRRGKQFNTLIYADVDPLTGSSRDDVLINPDDAADLHLKHGDQVTLHNDRARLPFRAFIADVARGTLQAHWPEANPLIATGPCDPAGGVPDYNATVRVERVS